MSKRRLDKLEGSLSPKEAVLHWLDEAHAFGSLPAYVESLVEQPEAMQPFVALPNRVSNAIWETMRAKRTSAIKTATREAIGDTIFLLRLVIGLNVHVEETLRTERLRHAALVWWSRALHAEGAKSGDRSGWERSDAVHRGILLGTERARAAAEARYLDGHDILFPELATEWHDLCAAGESLADAEVGIDDAATRAAERSARRVILMARADGLEAAGQHLAADAMADRVGRHLAPAENTDG